jgi:hypothetical protein
VRRHRELSLGVALMANWTEPLTLICGLDR